MHYALGGLGMLFVAIAPSHLTPIVKPEITSSAKNTPSVFIVNSMDLFFTGAIYDLRKRKTISKMQPTWSEKNAKEK